MWEQRQSELVLPRLAVALEEEQLVANVSNMSAVIRAYITRFAITACLV